MPRLTPENKELHIAQMREHICRVFSELFAAEGDVSMEHLAEKSGIAKGTIYNYFKDKKELTAAVMESRRKAMIGLMEEAISPDAPAVQQLETFVGIMWQDFHTHRHLRLEYLRNNPVRHIPLRPRPVDLLERIVAKGIAEKTFREVDSAEAALFVFCSLLGKFRHYLIQDLPALPQEETAKTMSFLLPALKA
jgi:AcrR family transcriptional regulator